MRQNRRWRDPEPAGSVTGPADPSTRSAAPADQPHERHGRGQERRRPVQQSAQTPRPVPGRLRRDKEKAVGDAGVRDRNQPAGALGHPVRRLGAMNRTRRACAERHRRPRPWHRSAEGPRFRQVDLQRPPRAGQNHDADQSDRSCRAPQPVAHQQRRRPRAEQRPARNGHRPFDRRPVEGSSDQQEPEARRQHRRDHPHAPLLQTAAQILPVLGGARSVPASAYSGYPSVTGG